MVIHYASNIDEDIKMTTENKILYLINPHKSNINRIKLEKKYEN